MVLVGLLASESGFEVTTGGKRHDAVPCLNEELLPSRPEVDIVVVCDVLQSAPASEINARTEAGELSLPAVERDFHTHEKHVSMRL